MDRSGLNSRGMIVLGLGVIATIILLAVVPKDGSPGGTKYLDVAAGAATTQPGVTTTVGGGTSSTTAPPATTKPSATATTKKGTTTTAPPATTVNPATRPVLKLGSSGPDVVTLQNKLTAAGFSPGTADGNFGPGTQAQVIAFQKSKGLTADGVVGASTWAALG